MKSSVQERRESKVANWCIFFRLELPVWGLFCTLSLFFSLRLIEKSTIVLLETRLKCQWLKEIHSRMNRVLYRRGKGGRGLRSQKQTVVLWRYRQRAGVMYMVRGRVLHENSRIFLPITERWLAERHLITITTARNNINLKLWAKFCLRSFNFLPEVFSKK